MKPAGFGEVAERIRRSTVQISSAQGRARGSGSGIVWTPDGTVITNAHVARDQSLRVELWDGRCFPAQVSARDDRADLASLKLPPAGTSQAADLPALAWRPAHTLRPGELVIAVGNPLGFVGALTTGVVHTAGPIRGLGRNPWIQAAIRLAPGNSGGPLADAQGRVVGVNTMVVAGGLALAIPAERVIDFLEHGRRPALGVTLRPVRFASFQQASVASMPGERPPGRPAAASDRVASDAAPSDAAARIGLLVMGIEPGSPAENVSLAVGDVLLAANGRGFASVDDLADAIDESAGAVLRLRFVRGGQLNEREVSVAVPGFRREAA
jgi:serine protease Do